MLPLDKNESYWMLDEHLAEVVLSQTVREFSRYPEYSKFKSELAVYAGVTPENLLITPGSDSAIEHIARAFATGGEVILPVPTFYGYETILDRVGARIVPITYTERDGKFIFPLLETIAELKRDSAKVLFLCHPNNPLGCSLSKEDIRALVDAVHRSNMLIVVDEAYFEFAGSTFLSYLAGLPNLVILRSFSKTFALAGARVGYAIAAPSIIVRLQNDTLSWPVAHPSIAAVRRSLAHESEVRPRRELVIEARESFSEALRTIPNGTVYPSETNFVLMRIPEAARVRDALLAQDIRVALGESMSRFPNAKKLLHDTLRVAVPAPESQDFFIETCKKSYNKSNHAV